MRNLYKIKTGMYFFKFTFIIGKKCLVKIQSWKKGLCLVKYSFK